MNVEEKGEFVLIHPCLSTAVWFLRSQKNFVANFRLASLSAASTARHYLI